MKNTFLTDNDRQRIEQEINRIWFRTDTAGRKPIELLKEIAEYATRYEREKQAKCKCNGTGRKMYPNTATFRSRPGIIVGHAFTEDVCNLCWGSGDMNNPNHNPLFDDLNKAQKERYEVRKQVKQLEAERTELRAKVIEEILTKLDERLSEHVTHEGDYIAVRISELQEIVTILNSLKTK